MAKRKRKKKGTGNLTAILVLAAITAAVGIAALVFFSGWLYERAPMPDSSVEVRLYFASDEGTYLAPETFRVKAGPVEARLREAMAALVAGPRTGLTATMPEGARLIGVSVRERVAYVDMSRELQDAHTGGSSGEILTVYSIVNTAALNFDAIDEVQILVEGKAVDTLAGHIDISLPLPPDTRLLRGRKTIKS